MVKHNEILITGRENMKSGKSGHGCPNSSETGAAAWDFGMVQTCAKLTTLR